MKSDKMPYIIYADIESLITKIDECANSPENSSPTKIGEHIPCGYLMSTLWAFDNIANKHTFLYCGEDCKKIFCESLREHAKNIDFEKEKMLPLTKEELKSYQDTKVCYICGKRFLKKFAKDNIYQKVTYHCHFTSKYWGAAHSICNLKFNVPNKILVAFQNDSNYDYHFTIRELANESEGQFECLGENTVKYTTFSIPTEK